MIFLSNGLKINSKPIKHIIGFKILISETPLPALKRLWCEYFYTEVANGPKYYVVIGITFIIFFNKLLSLK